MHNTLAPSPPAPSGQHLESAARRPMLVPFGVIRIARGVGSGPTVQAARDSAMLNAGLGNYHLIPLGAAMPPGSQIVRGRLQGHPLEFGQRLYGVLSIATESRPGRSVYAGLGWAREPVGGQGLLVDLQDADEDRLTRGLHTTLHHMQKDRGVSFGPVSTEIAGMQCENDPVCALVVAVFRSEPW
ncbi:pyruvoyl-dependent arginine decarboxylase [Ideonella margarita]|uniref:Pyruvoyl-dependent arginine decarboxylase AaxB n=1 Tax=Ideonella margarita TaxID=2984191 RepID=A0ABU9C1T1_9BURK